MIEVDKAILVTTTGVIIHCEVLATFFRPQEFQKSLTVSDYFLFFTPCWVQGPVCRKKIGIGPGGSTYVVPFNSALEIQNSE